MIAVGQKIQEEQQARTNVILGIVMVLSTLASIQQIQGYIILTQKWIGLNDNETLSIVIALVLGVVLYVYGKKILKWIKKRKK
jgi:hypothetical protein